MRTWGTTGSRLHVAFTVQRIDRRFDMGREVRMVPADWQHPRDERGQYKALHDGFNKDLEEWNQGNDMWRKGFRKSYSEEEPWEKLTEKNRYGATSYADYAGDQPKTEDYMPDWPPEQRTHLMMYETTSEGTPISPAFPTPESLARWLADTNASAFGGIGATYEQWLSTCRRGSAFSAAFVPGRGMISGVAAMADHDEE